MTTDLAVAAAIMLAAACVSAPSAAYEGALLGGHATGSVLGDIAAGGGYHGYTGHSPGYASHGYGSSLHHPAGTHSSGATYGALPYHRRWNRYHW